MMMCSQAPRKTGSSCLKEVAGGDVFLFSLMQQSPQTNPFSNTDMSSKGQGPESWDMMRFSWLLIAFVCGTMGSS